MLPEYRGQADAQSADPAQGDPAVRRDHRLPQQWIPAKAHSGRDCGEASRLGMPPTSGAITLIRPPG